MINITVSAPNIEVTLFSLHTYGNSITAVEISLMVIKKSAFNPAIVYFNGEFDSYFQYVNNVSTCQTCPSECATCLNSSYCLTCASANFLSSNQCVSCGTGCLTCTGLSACTQCEDIYALSSGQCANCTTTAGFFFSNNVCNSCHSSCAECEGVANNCSSCATGYTLDTATRTCVPPPNTIIDCLYTSTP